MSEDSKTDQSPTKKPPTEAQKRGLEKARAARQAKREQEAATATRLRELEAQVAAMSAQDPVQVAVPARPAPLTHVGNVPVPMFARNPMGGTANFRIEDFDQIGYLKVIIYTRPSNKRNRPEEVMNAWVNSERFSVNLMGSKKLPLTLIAFRRPMDISDTTVPKETGKPMYLADKSTWTSEALMRGAQSCADNGFCEHERAGQAPCPPPIELGSTHDPDFLIDSADETWVIRKDGPPVKESDLDRIRAVEQAKDRATNERIAHAMAIKAQASLISGFPHPTIAPSVPVPHPAEKQAGG